MRFLSIRGGPPAASWGEMLRRGLAPDGGLWVPERVPPADPAAWSAELTPAERAACLLAPFTAGAHSRDDLEARLAPALDFPLPLRQLATDTWLLELFHGPTLAFKDVGARCLARLLVAPSDDAGGGELTLLTATSGDTGGAVAAAFHGLPGVRVVVLYPQGRVSPRQSSQFATLGGNVHAVAVAGDFDACQRLVKEAFADPVLARQVGLASANSINLGRLLPQMTHFAQAIAAWQGEAAPLFVVPCGNFGNLTAGLLAARMGLPAAGFVAATNANDTVPRFLAGEPWRPRPALATLSSAMDVGAPSNWERVEWLTGGPAGARRAIAGSSHGDAEVSAIVRRTTDRCGVVVDPHTAVGLAARHRYRELSGDRRPAVVLATAHPAKFGETLAPILGAEPAVPARLAERWHAPDLSIAMEPRFEELRGLLTEFRPPTAR